MSEETCRTYQIFRPPPPSIQMYSMEEPEDPRGPIYDTINEDNAGPPPPPPPAVPNGWETGKKPSTFSSRHCVMFLLLNQIL